MKRAAVCCMFLHNWCFRKHIVANAQVHCATLVHTPTQQQRIIMVLFIAFATVIMTVAIGGVKAMEWGKLDIKGLQQLWYARVHVTVCVYMLLFGYLHVAPSVCLLLVGVCCKQ